MKKSTSQHKKSSRQPAKSTASDESNDTLTSRRYLKDSLAQDPWIDNPKPSQSQLKNDKSNESKISPKRNKSQSSRRTLRDSMLDVPNVRDSILTAMASNTSSRNIDLHGEESKRRSDVTRIQRNRESGAATGAKNRDRKSAVTKKDMNAIPPTEELSSLALDESEVGNRSSLFRGYWDSTNLPRSVDEEESGAMALVRSIEGDIIREGAERKRCHYPADKFNAKVVLLCVVVFAVVVMLVMVIPYQGNDMALALNTTNEHVPTLLPFDLDETNNVTKFNNDTNIQSNSDEPTKEQLSLAEEVIKVCNPYGYDQDKYKCYNLCNDKECCFQDDERDTYCGDEIWHNCLEYAGCQPFFSR